MRKDLLTLADLSGREILNLIRLAKAMKRDSTKGGSSARLRGRCLALLFMKPSTRTRVSFEVAIHQLGGYSIFLGATDMQLSRGELVEDTAKTLSRYVDFIAARVFAHEDVERLAGSSSVPVINALSNTHHPCQALSDLMTISELKERVEGIKLAWIGDGNNVCNELMLGATKLGMNFSVASPRRFKPPKSVIEVAAAEAERTGSRLEVTEDPRQAAYGADVIATDSFVSMGDEAEWLGRLKAFLPRYRVTTSIIKRGAKDVIFMHCLPAKRGQEVSGDVLDGPSSAVWLQVENKLHMHKALLVKLAS